MSVSEKLFAYFTMMLTCYGMSAQSHVDTIIHEIEEVEVISARVSDKVISSAPAYNLNNSDMMRQGVSDLTDAIHRLPGVNIRDYGGAGGMKTVSVRGFGSTHTGVIYDGAVLSDCQSGSIDLSRYSLDNISSLSLVVGDNADIFIPAKAAASAASLYLNTLSVPEADDMHWKLRIQLKTGSWGLINPYIMVGKTFSESLSCSVIGNFSHSDNNYPFTIHNGILTSSERRDNSRMNSGHGEINAKYRLSKTNLLLAKIYYYDSDRQLPGPVVLYNSESHETLKERNFFTQLTWESSLPYNLNFRGLAKFNWDSSKYHDIGASYPGGETQENFWQREAYASGALMWQPLERLSFNYSADYTYNSLSSNQIENPRPWRHSILQSMSAKFKNSHVLAMARLLLSVYDNEVHKGASAVDATRISPSFSVSVQPWKSKLLFVRVSYKNIFRMPTFNDSYYFKMGSTQLKPETTDQINLGVTYQAPYLSWLPLATLTADVYANHVRDKIVAIPRTMYIWTMTNLDKVRALGVDLTLNGTLRAGKNHDILISGTYSFQRVQPRTNPKNPDWNKQLAYTPVHSGSFSVAYENPWVNITFHATGVGERFGINSNPRSSRIAGYMDFGVSLWKNIKVNGHNIELRGDLLNLFDHQYEVVARYPMPGRSCRLSAAFIL